jgi:D-threo-aldose 1-dehydrogenase
MRASRRERERLLHAAYDIGLREFDVARLYGLGAAEGELGRILKTRRNSVVIATKFGIEAGRLAQRSARFQRPGRIVVARSPGLRSIARKRGSTPGTPRTFDAIGARRSLDQSLRFLDTDYVDVLFVHDPRAEDTVDIEGLREFFTAMQAAGRIREWGVSAEGISCLALTDAIEGSVAQVRRDLTALDASLRRPERQVNLFGVIQPALTRLTSFVRSYPDDADHHSQRIGIDLTDPELVLQLLLAEASHAASGGAVLVGVTSLQHLASVSQARPQAPEILEAFRTFVLACEATHGNV